MSNVRGLGDGSKTPRQSEAPPSRPVLARFGYRVVKAFTDKATAKEKSWYKESVLKYEKEVTQWAEKFKDRTITEKIIGSDEIKGKIASFKEITPERAAIITKNIEAIDTVLKEFGVANDKSIKKSVLDSIDPDIYAGKKEITPSDIGKISNKLVDITNAILNKVKNNNQDEAFAKLPASVDECRKQMTDASTAEIVGRLVAGAKILLIQALQTQLQDLKERFPNDKKINALIIKDRITEVNIEVLLEQQIHLKKEEGSLVYYKAKNEYNSKVTELVEKNKAYGITKEDFKKFEDIIESSMIVDMSSLEGHKKQMVELKNKMDAAIKEQTVDRLNNVLLPKNPRYINDLKASLKELELQYNELTEKAAIWDLGYTSFNDLASIALEDRRYESVEFLTQTDVNNIKKEMLAHIESLEKMINLEKENKSSLDIRHAQEAAAEITKSAEQLAKEARSSIEAAKTAASTYIESTFVDQKAKAEAEAKAAHERKLLKEAYDDAVKKASGAKITTISAAKTSKPYAFKSFEEELESYSRVAKPSQTFNQRIANMTKKIRAELKKQEGPAKKKLRENYNRVLNAARKSGISYPDFDSMWYDMEKYYSKKSSDITIIETKIKMDLLYLLKVMQIKTIKSSEAGIIKAYNQFKDLKKEQESEDLGDRLIHGINAFFAPDRNKEIEKSIKDMEEKYGNIINPDLTKIQKPATTDEAKSVIDEYNSAFEEAQKLGLIDCIDFETLWSRYPEVNDKKYPSQAQIKAITELMRDRVEMEKAKLLPSR